MIAAQPETNSQYHADTSHVSASMLKALNKSPRIYQATYVTGELAFKETPAMALGTAIHTFALEPEVFDKEYAVSPHSDKRKKDYKDWAKANEGRKLLSFDEAVVLDRCLDSLRSIPVVRTILDAEGLTEESVRFEDSLSQVPCKCKSDKVLPEKRLILDIKTTNDLSKRSIEYACEDFGYHIQDAHYRTAWATHTATDVDDWQMVFAFVETKPPYRSQAVMLDWDSRSVGMDLRQKLLSEWIVRNESGDWSQHGEHEILEVTLPSVYRRRAKGE